MVLKPQDVFVLLKLLTLRGESWSYTWLSAQLGMNPSQLHSAVKRALAAHLAVREGEAIVPDIQNLEEFLIHGLKYVFIPEQGGMSRGIPTAHAAPPLSRHFVSDAEPPPVWPDANGEVRGTAFSPLYKLGPRAAQSDPELYELLALVDAIRGGLVQERERAMADLRTRLGEFSVRHWAGTAKSENAIPLTDDLHVRLDDLHALARRFHIRRAALFGSAARGELRPESDIDLLVEFEPGKAPSLWAVPELEKELSRLFGGRSVDIVPPEVLRNPYRRKTIVRDLKVLLDGTA